MIYRLSPYSPDPLKYWGQLGTGLAHEAEHPLGFGEQVVNLPALEQHGFSYWLGSMTPAVALAVAAGGAGAAVRGMTGVTALERAGLTFDQVANLSSEDAAAVIMRGEKPMPGMITREATNFTGPAAVDGPRLPDLFGGNVHDASGELLGPRADRSMKYLAGTRDLLGIRSDAELRAKYALPGDWGRGTS